MGLPGEEGAAEDGVLAGMPGQKVVLGGWGQGPGGW